MNATYITLRQFIEKTVEFNKPLFLCFVNLKQAFDRVRLVDISRSVDQGHNICGNEEQYHKNKSWKHLD